MSTLQRHIPRVRLLLALALPLPGLAQTVLNWANTGTTFSTGSNWIGGVAPADNFTSNIASFGTASPTAQPILTASQSVAGLAFASGAGAFTLSGSSTQINVGASGINNASTSATQTISTVVVIGANASFTNSGTLTLSNAVGLQGFALTLNGSGSNGTINAGINGINGTGSITKSGTGTWTLASTNSYSGGTTIAGGTLALGAPGALGATGTISFTGGTLQFSSGNTTDYSARFSTAASQAYSFNTNGQSVTLATALTSSGGSLSKSGSGTLTLTGTNTYSGGTTISGGTLTVASDANLGASTGGLTLSGGTLNFGSGTVTSTRPVSLTAASTITHTGALTLSGAISGAGALTKAGAGTLTLSGANTFSGGATLSAGTLLLNSSGALGSSGTISLGGGTLQFSSSNTADYSARFSTAASQAYTFDTNGQSVTLGSALTSSGGALTKLGAGTLTLSGANTYTGSTTVSAGTLAFGAANALSSSNVVSIASGTVLSLANFSQTIGSLSGAGNVSLGSATLTLGGTNASTTLPGIISGTGGLAKNGTGTLTLSGANTFSGGVALNDGTLALASSGAIGSAGTLSFGGGTLQFSASNTTDYSARFSGAANQAYAIDINGQNATLASALTSPGGTLTVYGFSGGKLTLAGNNTYSGGTNLYGLVELGSSGALGNAGTIFFSSGGALRFTANNTTDYSARFATATNQVIALDTNGQTVTLASALPNPGNVTLYKFGTGTLILTGNNSGIVTNVSGGTVQIGAGGTTGSVDGYVLVYSGNSLVWNRSDDVSFGNTMNGAGSLVKSGAGSLTLSGASNLTGGITINTGTLRVGDGGTTGSIAADVSVANGAALVFNRSDAVTAANVVSGGGSLTMAGTGTLTLSGANTYTGGTTVSAGTLQVGDSGTSGSIAGNVSVASGAALAFDRTDAVTFASAISGAGALVKSGANTLTLTGADTHLGGTTINAGTLQIGAGGTTGSLTGDVSVAAGASLAFNRSDSVTFSGVVSGAGGITQTGAGALTLAGANTYTGDTTVSAGALIGNVAAIRGNLVNDGAVTFNQGTDATYPGVISGAGALTKAGGGALALTGSNTFVGGTTVTAGLVEFSTLGNLGSGSVTLNGGGLRWASGTTTDVSPRLGALGAAGATFDTNGSNVTFATAIGGSGSLTKIGPGTLTLTAATYSGATTINAGTLALVDTASRTYAGAISGAGALALATTGTLTLTGSNSSFSGGATLNFGTVALGADNALGTGAVSLNGATLAAGGAARALTNAITLDNDSALGGTQPLTLAGRFTLARNRDLTVSNTALTTISGVIDESGGGRVLAKYGSGELALTGANTYTGGTFIGAGTVRINNSSGSAFGTGAVTVASGATLTGAGSFTGALQNNGNYSPGNSPALTTLSSFNQGSTGTLIMELGGLTRGTQYDALNVTGAITFGGTLTVNLINGYTSSAGSSYTLFNWGSASGTFSSVNLPTLPGLAWDTSALYTTGMLSVTAIPEPGTYATIAGLSVFCAVLWRRRKKRREA